MLARWLRCWRTARWGSSGESLRHTRGGGDFSVIEHMDMFMQENDSHNSKHTSDQPLLFDVAPLCW